MYVALLTLLHGYGRRLRRELAAHQPAARAQLKRGALHRDGMTKSVLVEEYLTLLSVWKGLFTKKKKKKDDLEMDVVVVVAVGAV